MSVLFITHDMGVVAEIADRMVVMRDGRASRAAKRRPLRPPSHSYTRALLSAAPRLGSMTGRAAHALRHDRSDQRASQKRLAETPDTIAAEAPPVLQVSRLVTRYDIGRSFFGRAAGRIHAVEDVSFDLAPGETLGWSGNPDAARRRSADRSWDLRAGKRIDRRRWRRDSASRSRGLRRLRRRVQMIFQDPFASLNPRMSIGEAIAEPLLAQGFGDRAETRERVADSAPGRSRAGHGQALPARILRRTAAADLHRARARGRTKADRGGRSGLGARRIGEGAGPQPDARSAGQPKLAYLFISHDMAVVERVSHRVAVMYLGEIVEIGPRDVVFSNPQHAYTRRLMKPCQFPIPAWPVGDAHCRTRRSKTRLGRPTMCRRGASIAKSRQATLCNCRTRHRGGAHERPARGAASMR